MPNSQALLDEARQIKREAISHLDGNLQKLIQAAKSSGVNVHLAADGAAAIRLAVEISRRAGAKLIVKSKSMTGEEIDLRQGLEAEGFRVVETDLGERIIQLANQRPAHMVAPAIDMSVEDVAELFRNKTGKEIPPEPERLTAFARESLREDFLHADLGIVGANFALADSGAIVLVTNEGNGRLVTALPRTLISVFGIEKIVANTSDAFTLLQALVLSGAGRRLTSYVTIFKGGGRLAQDGTRQELHFIIVDNGRSRMRGDTSFRETLYCIRCGACNDICPTLRLFGGHVFGYRYTGPIGIPWTEYTATPDQAGEFAPLCISCGLCQTACPEDINIPLLIARVKEEYTKNHGQLTINRTLCNYESFVGFASAISPISNYLLGRPIFRQALEMALGLDARRGFPKFTRHTFKKWFREHTSAGIERVAYFVDTYADMCDPQIGEAVVGVLETNGFRVEVPEQVGSGIPAFLYGDVSRTKRAAEFNVRNLVDAIHEGCEIVSSEPTATYCLKELYPQLLDSSDAKLVAAHSHDIFDYLLQLHTQGELREDFLSAPPEPAAYYASCHTRSVYGKSPALEILKLAGVDARPVRYTTCCGIAGTFGFKKGVEGYDVSMAIGETLFQRLKAMNVNLVLTESSVCKMQIEHGTSLRVLHPVTLLRDMYQRAK